MQKGFAILPVLIIVGIMLAGGGYYLYSLKTNNPISNVPLPLVETTQPAVSIDPPPDYDPNIQKYVLDTQVTRSASVETINKATVETKAVIKVKAALANRDGTIEKGTVVKGNSNNSEYVLKETLKLSDKTSCTNCYMEVEAESVYIGSRFDLQPTDKLTVTIDRINYSLEVTELLNSGGQSLTSNIATDVERNKAYKLALDILENEKESIMLEAAKKEKAKYVPNTATVNVVNTTYSHSAGQPTDVVTVTISAIVKGTVRK